MNAKFLFGTIFIICCLNRVGVCQHYFLLENNDTFYSTNCTLLPKLPQSELKLEKMLMNDGLHLRLIRLHITVSWGWNFSQPENETYPVNLEWFLATKESGKRLLLLDKNFEIMSLGALSHGVEKLSMEFVQEPEDCLKNLTVDEAVRNLYNYFLSINRDNNMDNENTFLEICNGSSDPQSVCCKKNLRGYIVCDLHTVDELLRIFQTVTRLLILYALFNTPRLIPRSWYTENQNCFTCENNESCIKAQVKVKISDCDASKDFQPIPRPDGNLADKLCEFSLDESNNSSSTYALDVSFKNIFANSDRLESEILSNSGLKQLLSRVAYTFTQACIRCKLRKEKSVRQRCMCCSQYFRLCDVYLFECLGLFMKVIIFLFFWMPIIVRFLFFHSVKNATGYTFFGPMDFSMFNVVYLFLLVYLLGISFFVFVSFLIFPLKSLKEYVSTCVSTALDMSLIEQFRGMISAWHIIIESFQDFGFKEGQNKREKKSIKFRICKSLLFPLIILLLVLVAVYYLLGVCLILMPFFCLIALLITRTINYFRKLLSSTHYIWICVYYLLMLFIESALLGFLTVVYDCVAFYTYCLAYIILGFSINSNNVLPYITLVLLICSYAYSCLNEIHTVIDKFKKTVISIITERYKDLSERAYRQAIKRKKNVFTEVPPPENNSEDLEEINISPDGKLFWSPRGLLLFQKFDAQDELSYLHISEDFLNTVATHQSKMAPGSKTKLYIKAAKGIFIMFVILAVVLFGILSFGDTHGLSEGVQALVTVGSGLVLFIFNKLLFRSRSYSIDDKGMHIKTIVDNVLRTYSEAFEIDYTITAIKPENSENVNMFVYLTTTAAGAHCVRDAIEDNKMLFYIPKSSVDNTFFERKDTLGEDKCKRCYSCCACCIPSTREDRPQIVFANNTYEEL